MAVGAPLACTSCARANFLPTFQNLRCAQKVSFFRWCSHVSRYHRVRFNWYYFPFCECFFVFPVINIFVKKTKNDPKIFRFISDNLNLWNLLINRPVIAIQLCTWTHISYRPDTAPWSTTNTDQHNIISTLLCEKLRRWRVIKYLVILRELVLVVAVGKRDLVLQMVLVLV